MILSLKPKKPGETGRLNPKEDVSLLVSRAQDGDANAFGQLVRLHQDDVFRMVYYRIRSKTDSEDITQDAFLKAFRSIGKLKHPERFRSWLSRITLNCLRDHLKKERLLRLYRTAIGGTAETGIETVPDKGLSPEQSALAQEFWRKTGAALGTLSRMEREVFILRFFDRHGLREISEVLGRSESTVKTHLYRAVRKMKCKALFRDLQPGGMR